MPFRFGKSTAESIRTVGSLMSVGFAFVIAIVIGFWFGRTLDNWLGSSPWFALIFFFIGLAAGVLSAIRTVRAATASSKAKEPPEAGSR